jgi:hypothetical protein
MILLPQQEKIFSAAGDFGHHCRFLVFQLHRFIFVLENT